ncbi:MAG: MFS transporter [Clostridia bacterium]|nr:MFS transporter [Clostridia bacterium]
MDIEIEHMKKPELKYRIFMWACLLLYIITMVGKSIFTAELDIILDAFSVEKSSATLSNLFYYITYAVTQIILAFMFSKINVRKMLVITLPFSAISYIILIFAKSIKTFWVIFALNGIFQAGAFSGCVYLLTTFLPESMHQKAKKLILAGFAIGNTFAYILAIFTISFFNKVWQIPFIITSIIFTALLIVFPFVAFKLKPIQKENKEEQIASDELPPIPLKSKKSKVLYYTLSIMYSLLSYAMYYGVSGLFATSIKNIFGISQDNAIYISLAIPIITYLGPVFGVFYSEKQPNFVKCCLVLSAVIIAILTVICIFYNSLISNLFLSIIMILLTLTFVLLSRAVTSFSVTISFKMRSEINAGVYSAITNAIASVSAGATPYILSLIIENTNGGWRSQYIFSLILGLILAITILFSYIITKNNFKEKCNA